MTIEELLKPRYKVIAKYPESRFGVDEILTQWIGNIFVGKNPYTVLSNPNDYPAIFKELKWWQEREIEDLPKYLKIDDSIRKVIKWDFFYDKVIVTNLISKEEKRNYIGIYTPLSEEEYLQFTNQK